MTVFCNLRWYFFRDNPCYTNAPEPSRLASTDYFYFSKIILGLSVHGLLLLKGHTLCNEPGPLVNPSLRHCVILGPHHDAICFNIVTSSGLAQPWVDEIRYLGVFKIRNRRFKCSLVNSKRLFYRSVNAILGKILSTVTVDVVLHLINSKCIPVLLYGLVAH